MAELKTKINGIEFPNPVLTAAGPNVRNGELLIEAAQGGAGGLVSKTISTVAADDPRPTIRCLPCKSLMNCETWAETPPEEFIEDIKKVKSETVPLIVSIGYKPEEVALLGPLVERELHPDAIEFSVHYVGRSVEPIVEIARTLKEVVTVPIWLKLSPNFLDIEELAVAASPYIDAFVAINSFGPVLDFDPDNVSPYLGSEYGQGWLSGSSILPIALSIVYRVARAQEKPVIGVGGVSSGIDAIKFLMAGASAVQVCSAAIKNGHSIYGEIAQGIDRWLDSHNYGSVSEIIGLYGKSLTKRKLFTNKPKMTVVEENCVGCGVCVSRCIQGALSMEDKLCIVNYDRCIGCGFCAGFCKFNAMELRKG